MRKSTAILVVLALIILLPSLASGGEPDAAATSGWFGFGFCSFEEPVPEERAQAVAWLQVNLVLSGGPAWRAGMQQGDFILEIDHRPVTPSDDVAVLDALASLPVGVAAAFKIQRGAEQMELLVTPEPMTPEQAQRWKRNYESARARETQAHPSSGRS